METFESRLGDIEVGDEGFERKKDGDWENLLEKFPEEKIVDEASYSEVEGIKLEKGSVNPCIKVMIDGEWKYVFFEVNDPVKSIWKRLRYNWQAYLQRNRTEEFRKS